jgi:endonuclease YncB( thermonuclease family)
LSLNRPRRIFRSYLARIDPRWLLGLLGGGLLALAAVSLATLSASQAPPRPVPAEALTARPAQVAVVDAGTLRLRDRIVLLRGVEPPPRGTACGERDCGSAGANALADLVRDATVECRVAGQDGLGRPYGVCLANGNELNRAVVAAGWARAAAGEPELRRAQEAAQAGRLGVWGADANQ